MAALGGWANFYVIVGAAAGALIGLQFVVMTLIAGRPVDGGEAQAGDAFSTPSVVHFGVVLLLSAVNTAPWEGVGTLAVLWGMVGLGGVAYAAVVARRMRAQRAYRPVFEDWLFHVLLPLPDEEEVRHGVPGVVNADEEEQQRRGADEEQGRAHVGAGRERRCG